MKKLVQIEETGITGFEELLGKRVTFFCLNYIYTGDLTGVNDTHVQLTKPAIVYETGPFTDKKWKDAQPLPNVINVMMSAVEAFGEVK